MAAPTGAGFDPNRRLCPDGGCIGVIGADGVHSVIRGAITTPAPAEYSGMCAFRALVPADEAPEFARRPVQTLWIGPDHHLVHYPVSAGKLVNIVAFAPAS